LESSLTYTVVVWLKDRYLLQNVDEISPKCGARQSLLPAEVSKLLQC